MKELVSEIRTELEQNGSMPFARFMELALYAPEKGYYERPRAIGRGGDFFTSVSVGNLFGELLAFQFAKWLEEGGTADRKSGLENFRIVEAGAHDGKLAADILNWFRTHRPKCFPKLEYCILEPSSSRREWQRKTLAEFSDHISWCNDWSEFPSSEFSTPRFTVVFSNELFDAMPVHRLGWDATEKNWFEWGVDWEENRFIWKRLPQIPNNVPLPNFPHELREVLPDGFTTEVCPAATQWWTEAAKILDHGKLMAIDYGLVAEEFFVPERSSGTLRAYFQHHASSDLLASPGEQDLTAHVNFTALKSAGELAGLKTEMLVSQPKFLTGIAAQTWAALAEFGEWDGSRRKQFQTLTHPEHLGRAFRVLIQSR